MVCVDLGGGYERAARFFDRLQVFKRAASLGGVESLCSLPVLTSQWGHTDEELREAGVTRSMARLSVGLEDPEDLIADLDQALGIDRESRARRSASHRASELHRWSDLRSAASLARRFLAGRPRAGTARPSRRCAR